MSRFLVLTLSPNLANEDIFNSLLDAKDHALDLAGGESGAYTVLEIKGTFKTPEVKPEPTWHEGGL